MAPGSLGWLLAHELRLFWRGGMDQTGRTTRKRLYIGIGVASLVALPLLFGAFALAGEIERHPLVPTVAVLTAISAALLILWTLQISHTLNSAAQVIFLRGDLDLLLSSPLPPRRVLVIRALAIALNAGILYAVLSLPLLIALLWHGQWHWLAFYPLLAGFSLSATALALVLCMSLFRVFGARRLQKIAQVAAALLSLAIFPLSQGARFLPPSWYASITQWLDSDGAASAAASSNPLWWPSFALLGYFWPMLYCFLIGAALFTAVIFILGRRFAANVGAVAGIPATGASGRRAQSHTFGNSTLEWAVLRKEWRLLLRDAWLIEQALMQTLYLLPLCFAFARAGSTGSALVPAIVVIAGNLAAALTWITIRGEDAPDLVASSPVDVGHIKALKLAAALAPVACLLLIPLASIAFLSAWAGVCALVCCAATMLSSSGLCLASSSPGGRKNFGKRHKQSLIAQLLETLSQLIWAAAAGFAVNASPWAFAAAAVGAALMAGAWLRVRQKGWSRAD